MTTRFFDNPDLKNVREFMRESGNYLYIPAYQRSFTWTDSNIEQLFEDAVSGINMLMDERESISFIGAIVCFHDQEYTTIDPIVRRDVPERVLTIIDGQQRLIALTMIAGVLHNDLRTHIHEMPDDWLKDKAIETMNELKNILEGERTIGETNYYPRMIRAHKDLWARTLAESRYDSPLSHFVSDYHSFRKKIKAENLPEDKYTYQLPPNEGKEHKKFEKSIKSIESQVKKILSGDDNNMPPVAELLDSNDILSALFSLKEVPSSIDSTKMDERFLAVVLARYILEKICFVVVTVRHKEDYSFDIFESLNTTGQTLTAIETLLPEIVRHGNSESKEHLDIISNFLSGLNKEDEKKSVTEELVVNFALAENCHELNRSLRAQSGYLRKRYNGFDDNEKIKFTRHLMCASDVRQHLWGTKRKNLCEYPETPFSGNLSSETQELLKEADFCLDFLSKAKNKISRAVITRFYEHVYLSYDDEKEDNIKNFCSAIKSIAAFFALWRSSRQGTGGIDNRYRTLLKGDEGKNIIALCRSEGAIPSAEELAKNLRYFLREDGGNNDYVINSCAKWRERCSKAQMYNSSQSSSQSVCKFLLMVSSHNTQPKNSDASLLERVRGGAIKTLISDTWKSDDYKTIEHIIPQNIGPDEINRLGNLILLPLSVNSLLNDREWSQRKMIYEILSAETDEKLQEALNKNQNLPSPLSEGILEKIREKARCQPMTKAVSQFDKFEIDEIRKREENILTLAWEILAKDWLKWDA